MKEITENIFEGFLFYADLFRDTNNKVWTLSLIVSFDLHLSAILNNWKYIIYRILMIAEFLCFVLPRPIL